MIVITVLLLLVTLDLILMAEIRIDFASTCILILRKGGFTKARPSLNLNEAFVGANFAIFVEPDVFQPGEIFPSFTSPASDTSAVTFFESSQHQASLKSSVVKQVDISSKIKRLSLCQELDDLNN